MALPKLRLGHFCLIESSAVEVLPRALAVALLRQLGGGTGPRCEHMRRDLTAGASAGEPLTGHTAPGQGSGGYGDEWASCRRHGRRRLLRVGLEPDHSDVRRRDSSPSRRTHSSRGGRSSPSGQMGSATQITGPPVRRVKGSHSSTGTRDVSRGLDELVLFGGVQAVWSPGQASTSIGAAPTSPRGTLAQCRAPDLIVTGLLTPGEDWRPSMQFATCRASMETEANALILGGEVSKGLLRMFLEVLAQGPLGLHYACCAGSEITKTIVPMNLLLLLDCPPDGDMMPALSPVGISNSVVVYEFGKPALSAVDADLQINVDAVIQCAGGIQDATIGLIMDRCWDIAAKAGLSLIIDIAENHRELAVCTMDCRECNDDLVVVRGEWLNFLRCLRGVLQRCADNRIEAAFGHVPYRPVYPRPDHRLLLRSSRGVVGDIPRRVAGVMNTPLVAVDNYSVLVFRAAL